MAINFVGRVISSAAISLSWEVPTVPGVNIMIQYFRIDIEEVETSREWSITTMGMSAVVMSLHAYYTYNCRLSTVSNVTTYPTDTVVILLTHQAGMYIMIVTIYCYFCIRTSSIITTWINIWYYYYFNIIKSHMDSTTTGWKEWNHSTLRDQDD